MSTSLTGSSLTLNNTALTEDQLKILIEYKDVTVNVGDTVWLDGIECLCIATGVTIQGSSLTRIAVDKKHDLGYYQKYAGKVINGYETSKINYWRWGGYKTETRGTSQEVGYGLQNTNRCLANPVNFTRGSNDANNTYPLMWIGVNDFRASHSDKWFVPSLNELINYIYNNRSSLSFDHATGGSSTDSYWSSSEESQYSSYNYSFYYGSTYRDDKFYYKAVRLCRAF